MKLLLKLVLVVMSKGACKAVRSIAVEEHVDQQYLRVGWGLVVMARLGGA